MLRLGKRFPLARRRGPVACFQIEMILSGEKFIGVDLGVVRVPVNAIDGELVWCQRPKSPRAPLGLGTRLDRWLHPRSGASTIAPASLTKIGARYYVDRGHEQARDAARRRQSELSAHVIDYVHASGDLTGLLQRAQAEFSHKSGITEVSLSTPESYSHLLDQISEHRGHLEQRKGQLFSPSDAIADWLQRLYRPVVSGIQRDGVLDELPGLSAGDAYMHLTASLGRRAAEQGISLSDATEHVIASRQSWNTKMASIVPACIMEGRCPYSI